MERALPLLAAVGAGAVDTLNNVVINIGDRLQIHERRQQQHVQLNGKVYSTL